jgi:PilZ domain
MPSDYPALTELARYVPATGDQVALHLDNGETETVDVVRSHGSHIVVRTALVPEAGDAVGLVWMMPVGHAWCSAETVSQADGELELALGTVTVRESRRARRTAPARPVATSVLLGDGTIVAGRLLDVSDGGAALVVPDDSIRPGLVVHVTFTADGEAPVEADCVVMHTTARGDETLVGLAVETGTSGLLRLAGVAI